MLCKHGLVSFFFFFFLLLGIAIAGCETFGPDCVGEELCTHTHEPVRGSPDLQQGLRGTSAYIGNFLNLFLGIERLTILNKKHFSFLVFLRILLSAGEPSKAICERTRVGYNRAKRAYKTMHCNASREPKTTRGTFLKRFLWFPCFPLELWKSGFLHAKLFNFKSLETSQKKTCLQGRSPSFYG